jgi:hypothetical protein
MQIRMVTANGGRLKFRRAVLRCIALFLAALPLFAGLIVIPFDARRRGFPDRLVRTRVV